MGWWHSRTKMLFIGTLFFVLIAIAIGRLYYIQIVNPEAYKRYIPKQEQRLIPRGKILDRNGKVLANTIKTYSLWFTPATTKEIEILSEALPGSFKISQFRVGKTYKIAENLRGEEAKSILRKLKASGVKNVSAKPEYRRVYLVGEEMEPLLGFVGRDGSGLSGIEYYYDAELSLGKNLVLTVDASLQAKVWKILKEAVESYSALGGAAIVANPNTMEVLAMVSLPSFDPESPKMVQNRCVQWVYEPGSTFKVVVMASALEEGVVSENTTFLCEGERKIGSKTIRCIKAHGRINARDAIAYSCNIAMSKVSERLGQRRLEKYFSLFGICRRTGIDLPGEERGLLPPEKRWPRLTIATIGFGQGIAITPIQLVRAVAAVANGGKLLQPYVVSEIVDPETGEKTERRPFVVNRPLSEDTCELMRSFMVDVVERGTGKLAKIEGVKIAGKTGTAQKVVGGRYSTEHHVSSFVGFFPADSPKYVILVVIDDPKGAYYGGVVAAPVFKKIALALLEEEYEAAGRAH